MSIVRYTLVVKTLYSVSCIQKQVALCRLNACKLTNESGGNVYIVIIQIKYCAADNNESSSVTSLFR